MKLTLSSTLRATLFGAAVLIPSSLMAGLTVNISNVVGYYPMDQVDTDFTQLNKAPGAVGTDPADDNAVFEDTGSNPEWKIGPLCGYVRLNGATNNFFRITNIDAGSNKLAGASEITVMCWFKIEADAGVGNPDGLVVTRNAEDNVGVNRLYGLDQESDFKLDGRASNQASRSPANALTVNTWHHGAVVYDGTNRIVYVDGVVAESLPQSDITNIIAGGEWFIGVDPNNFGNRRFTGCIDDVAVLNCAVDPTTLASIAMTDVNGNPSSTLLEVLDPTYASTANPDGDGDSMCDTWETFYFGDLSQLGTDDDDLDNLSNANEMNTHFTDPTLADTDGDSLDDDVEIDGSSNPFGPSDPTDPLNADSDGDTLLDGDELDGGVGSAFITNPNAADTDGDGFDDKSEIDFGSDPTDGGSIPDFYPNLVGYWPLDNATGTVAVEKSGTVANDDGPMANAGALTWKLSTGPGDGICGYADLANENGAYFRIPEIPGIEGTDPKITIMGWVKPNQNVTTYRGMFMTRDVETNIGTGANLGLAVEGTNQPEARFQTLGGLDAPEVSAPTGVWTHVAMTYDGANRRLYVNGAEVANSPLGQSDITNIIDSNGWSIGCDNTTNGRQINGCLDDMAMFNINLPAGIINNIYTAGLAGDNLLTQFPTAPTLLSDDDSDNDGVCDQWEIDTIGDITTSDFAPGTDTDSDGLDDIDEITIHGTNPGLADTDGDLVNDGDELAGNENPYQGGAFVGTPGDPTDPLDDDSDNDTILDGDETNSATGSAFVTDPNSSDTDGDGISDDTEIADGTDPTDPASGNFPTITGNLIAYYNFDEGTGTVAADTGLGDGVAQDATQNQGAIAWLTGPAALIGNGTLDLDGGSSLNAAAAITGSTTAYTISVWVNPDSTSGYKGVYLTRQDPPGDGSNNWGIAVESTHTDNRWNGGQIDSTNIVQTGVWFHFVQTWDTSGLREVYIDGVLQGSDTAGPTSHTPGLAGWWIGDDPCCGGREINAQIDDLAVFDSVLTAEDIKDISDTGRVGVPVTALIPASGPPSISVTAVARVANDITITWDSSPFTGGTFSVRSTDDLAANPDPTTWAVIAGGAAIANGGATTSFTDTGVLPGTTTRYYQVVED